MDNKESQKILEKYDKNASIYRALADKANTLFLELLEDNDITVHSVTARLKGKDSLKNKIERPSSNYEKIETITDIVGLRVITYLADDVDKVGKIIEKEFTVDAANSVDKRKALDPDRFGYLSLHHVVSLKKERTILPEYKRYQGLKLEIQTRSILQHAWAEIEHDLGYKAKAEVPKHVRRRFSRVAGLLELADQEFLSMRDELNTYEENVPGQIETTPESVLIDKASLQAFIENDKTIIALDNKIAKSFSGHIKRVKEEFYDNYWTNVLNIQTIDELKKALVNNAEDLIVFAKVWLGKSEGGSLPQGISLFYLCYVLTAQKGDPNLAKESFSNIRTEDGPEGLIKRVFRTYKQIKSST